MYLHHRHRIRLEAASPASTLRNLDRNHEENRELITETLEEIIEETSTSRISDQKSEEETTARAREEIDLLNPEIPDPMATGTPTQMALIPLNELPRSVIAEIPTKDLVQVQP
jgi:hypothetical protein